MSVRHLWAGGVYSKQHTLCQGLKVEQHAHEHEHMSILASGKVLVRVGETVRTIVGPCAITIPANETHEITALTDTVWFCIWREDIAEADNLDSQGNVQ